MALGIPKTGLTKDAPAIYLAAFGKHPGWDDHIEDIGIETDRLAQIRSRLYVEGISGNIDSGAWDKLADDQRLATFAHEFVWCLGPSGKEPACVVVGRLWSSRDGKGRSKYPMAVYAQGVGVSAGFMARSVLPKLAALERACVEAVSAPGVKSAIDRTREELRAMLTQAGEGATQPADPEDVMTPGQIGAMADRDEFGPKPAGAGVTREGFVRALYAMERDFGPFLSLGNDARKSSRISTSKDGGVRAAHMRLPALNDRPAEAALQWISLLARRLARGSSMLAVAPAGGSFVDVIVGEPAASHLYCVRASAKGYPLTTDVPYVIDDAFRAKAAEMLGEWSGTPAPAPAPAPASGRPASAATSPARAESASKPPAASGEAPKKPGGMLKWIIGGVGIVAVGGITAMMLSGGEGSAQDPTKRVASNTTVADETAPTAAEIAEKERADREAKAREDKAREDKQRADAQAAEKASADKAAEDAKKGGGLKDPPQDTPSDAARQAEQTRLAQESAAKEQAEKDRRERDEAARLAAEKAREDKAREDKAREDKAREDKAAADKAAADKASEDKSRRDAEAAKAREAASRAEREKIESAAAELMSMLSSGYVLGEAGPGGRTPAQALDALRAMPGFAAASDGESIKVVAERVAGLADIERSTDRAMLVERASEKQGTLSSRLAAASRLRTLRELGWPRDAKEAEVAASVVGALRADVSGLSDPGRVKTLTARCDDLAIAFWSRRWKAIDRDDSAAIDSAVSSLTLFGIGESSLPAATRFNLLVHRARGAGGGADRAAVERFLAEAGAIDGLPESASAQVASIAASLSAPAPAASSVAPISIDGAGPGSASAKWNLTSTSMKGAVFSPPASVKYAGTLEFVRVETPTGVSYVSATEVPLGLFSAVIDAAGAWEQASKLMAIPKRDGPWRDGPVAWIGERNAAGVVTGIRPAPARGRDASKGWFDFVPAMTAQTSYFPAGREPAPPSAKHPMQHVSPGAALLMARTIGCRLPTVEESSALMGLGGDPSSNRRDAAFMAQVEYTAKALAGKGARRPDGGVFRPDPAAPRGDKALPAVESDDGTMFFREVDAGGSTGLRDVIGNVAEFVVTDAALGDLPPDAGAIEQALSRDGVVKVIGASALSGPEVEPARAYDVSLKRAETAFSDVGFRLAFSAGGSSASSGAASSASPGSDQIKVLFASLKMVEE